jgi:undecaprenyl-diphosphatase
LAEWVKVIILGVIEGVTEFLPISSTGHLLIAAALLDFQTGLKSTFEIFIQLGAVLAVIVFYRADLLRQVRCVRSDANVQRLWRNIAVAFLPAGVVGFVFNDWIKAALVESPASSLIVAVALVIGGFIFLLVERRYVETSPTADLSQVSLTQAILVGGAQVIALIPGVSRSGASIVGGMLGGLSRETATRFSFYLAIPTLGIATVYDLLTNLEQITPSTLLYLLLGTLVSALVAWAAIGWLLRYVSRSSFVLFGYYRIAVGLLVLLLIGLRILPS